jgi:hypothetical protein
MMAIAYSSTCSSFYGRYQIEKLGPCPAPGNVNKIDIKNTAYT